MRTTMLKLAAALSRSERLPQPIYEFGARRVPYQEHRGDVRSFFAGTHYVGCDLEPGPGVDQTQDLESLDLAADTIGTTILFDTIEHVRNPWRAMSELERCTAPGGILVMTSVMYFPIHPYPDDYWRFTASGFASLLQRFHLIAIRSYGLPKLPHTVLGIASKGAPDPSLERELLEALASWEARDTHTWKEHLMAVVPPGLLGPSYDLYTAALRRWHTLADLAKSGRSRKQ